ncbi:MAG: aminopeptidase [Leptothrix sp. (in: b-proteobacteria)]
MSGRIDARSRLNRLARTAAALLAAAAMASLGGCADLGYLWQSTTGHLRLLHAARPVERVLAEPTLSPELHERLLLSQRLRNYAVAALHLPDNASYRRYADLGRNAAVWNVVAAPELSLTSQTWCFPVVGCVAYRGYYDRAEAQAEADELATQGLDVSVYGVPAYSTLGKLPPLDWFADPLLNTFVTRYSEVELARLIFHELSHQVAFAAGDTTFNESFATAVERIGSAQWVAAQPAAEQQRLRALSKRADARQADFQRLARGLRDELAALYAEPVSDTDKRARKAAAIARLRAAHAVLKAGDAVADPAGNWVGYSGYDGWFADINNARLAVLAAYNAQVPDFERLYARQGRDWPRFFAEVRRLADLPAAERNRALSAP